MAEPARYQRLDESSLLEEDLVRGYKAGHYYPVHIGETFHDRYQVIGKLGYGSASNVWLCRDLLDAQVYVALKVYINSSKAHRELPIYEHINALQSAHPGRDRIRKLLDSFEIEGPHGNHFCLVHEALGMNLEELRELVPGGSFNSDLIRQCLRDILHGLRFLHQEAHIVHTDIQPKNILLGVLDGSAFERFVKYEDEEPLPRKELSSHTVYVSRPMPLTKGVPSLCDLSEARFDSPQNVDLVMPDVYRAPEVILDMPWSYPIDIWGFAMTLWDLFEPKRLFSPKGGDGRYSEEHHLAQMIAIMGPPPQDFLQKSQRIHLYWDDNGHWKGKVSIPDISLESMEQRLEGDEKKLFLTFMRKTLRWKPEDRSDAQGTFFDEWLLADLIKSGQIVREE